MARDDIGELQHHCGTVAKVRKDKNGRLYLACPHCGLLKYNLAGGQDYLLTAAKLYGPEGKPEPKAAAPEPPAPAPEKPKPAAAPEPKPAPPAPPKATPTSQDKPRTSWLLID